ncbi:hypothetical protein QQM79_02345 [Marinobacteraceae bacterium S3BR75-40.1]
MATMPQVSDLPYHLPRDTKGQLRALAKILSISPAAAEKLGEAGAEAMCAAILYRHLDRHQRYKAMKKMQSLPNKALGARLVALALDTTFLNPQWGLWSLTNEELAEDIRFHRVIDTVGAISGATLSLSSGKDVVKEVLRNGKLSPSGIALLVIGVAFAGNNSELNASIAEQKRRSQIKDSPYFR